MIEILASIVNTIMVLVQFVIDSIVSLITLITQIPTYLTFIIDSLSIMPSFLLPFMVAFISLVIVQYLLNRKAQ